MFFPTTPLSPQIYQELISLHYSRRLLLHDPLHKSPPPTSSNSIDPSESYTGTNGFDGNVVMILSVLLCALICSLGLNSIIKCALRCSNIVSTSSNNTNDTSNRSTNTGIKKKALKTFTIVNYSPDLKLLGLDTECVICLSEFAPGDRVRLLPKCNHGFHVRCIDKWLNSHSSCPTCRHCLIETCQKIVDYNQASSSQAVAPQSSQGTVINITPLEREDLVRCYRGIC